VAKQIANYLTYQARGAASGLVRGTIGTRWMAQRRLALLLGHRLGLADCKPAFAVATNRGRDRAVKVASGFD